VENKPDGGFLEVFCGSFPMKAGIFVIFIRLPSAENAKVYGTHRKNPRRAPKKLQGIITNIYSVFSIPFGEFRVRFFQGQELHQPIETNFSMAAIIWKVFFLERIVA
jgi:hypothetical protein